MWWFTPFLNWADILTVERAIVVLVKLGGNGDDSRESRRDAPSRCPGGKQSNNKVVPKIEFWGSRGHVLMENPCFRVCCLWHLTLLSVYRTWSKAAVSHNFSSKFRRNLNFEFLWLYTIRDGMKLHRNFFLQYLIQIWRQKFYHL